MSWLGSHARTGRTGMSVRVMGAVLQQSRATFGARLVLIAIADSAHDDGVAWPSIPSLARRAHVSERAVQYAIRRLIQLGELEVTERRGSSNSYRVLVGTGEADCTPAEVAPLKLVAPRGEASCTGGVKLASPRTVSEPLKNHHRAKSWPEDFLLTDARREVAKSAGVEMPWEWNKFKDHHQAKGSRFVS